MLQTKAAGTPILSFAWRRNDFALPEVRGDELVVTNFQAGDAGSYSVVVSSPFGSVTSAPIVLTLGYRLTVDIEGHGSVTRSPDSEIYLPGTYIELNATPGPLDDFLEWSGDLSSSFSFTTILLDTNRALTAHFVNTTLQLGTMGDGSITPHPNQSHYLLGDSVELTASSGRWFRFDRWEDGSELNPRRVIVGTNNHFSANFEPITRLETLTFNGVSRTAPFGMPAVFVNGNFVTNLSYHSVGPVSLRLVTSFDHGLIFYSLNGSPPTLLDRSYDGLPFTLARSATLRAIAWDETFTQSQEWDPVRIEIEPVYHLEVTAPHGGTVNISPLSNPPYYPSNSVVTLSAIPADGSSFLQWLGDATGTNATVSLEMNRDRCVEAIFGTSLQLGSSALGTIRLSQNVAVYPYDSVIELTALPEVGNTFVLWSGAVKGTNNPVRLTITQSRPTIAAGFASLPPGESSLTVVNDGSGSVHVSPPGNRYRSGTSVRLTASPDDDQRFLGWAGDAAGTENPLGLSMSQSRNIIARFSKRPRLEARRCTESLNEGTFEFQLSGEIGSSYEIETAQDVTGPWSHVSTVVNSLGRVQFVIPAGAAADGFFRASLVP